MQGGGKLASSDMCANAVMMPLKHMSWKKSIADQWAEKGRAALRAAMFVNAALLALASIYITAQFIWHFIGFLNRVVFSTHW
jgi:hypothetical protein